MTKKDVYWVATNFEISNQRRIELDGSHECIVTADGDEDSVGVFNEVTDFSLLLHATDSSTQELEKLIREALPQREGGILPCIEVNPHYRKAWTGSGLSVNMSKFNYTRFAEYLLMKDPEDKRWVHAAVGNSFKHFDLVVQTGKASRELGDLKEGLRRDRRINLKYLKINK